MNNLVIGKYVGISNWSNMVDVGQITKINKCSIKVLSLTTSPAIILNFHDDKFSDDFSIYNVPSIYKHTNARCRLLNETDGSVEDIIKKIYSDRETARLAKEKELLQKKQQALAKKEIFEKEAMEFWDNIGEDLWYHSQLVVTSKGDVRVIEIKKEDRVEIVNIFIKETIDPYDYDFEKNISNKKIIRAAVSSIIIYNNESMGVSASSSSEYREDKLEHIIYKIFRYEVLKDESGKYVY